jgi:uncharacterized protein YoxC
MKRDFLKSLGIEDKDIIDKIMDENSTDIGKAKGDTETLKQRITDLENDIRTKDATISTLQTKADSVDGLNQQIAQLQTDKTNLTNELNTKVSQIQKDHAIEGKIRDAKGKNIKAIKALLDMDKITYENNELGGIDDQLTALASAEDSSMLFGETQTPPAGTHFNNPRAGGNGGNPPTSNSFAEAVAKALTK